ncbi:DUF2254 domain-containing protein (plasmid) [Paracoccus sp. AK26]|nr:DUF2254 domain-containing protein [Paracoccus sp. AK26]
MRDHHAWNPRRRTMNMTQPRHYLSNGNASRALWDAVRTSLWFLPAIMGVLALGLTAGALALDEGLGQGSDESFPRIIYVSAPDQARELLATVLTSMITMASLVFSITMVVLTLAAGQFGPRLIRNFMGRLQTQFVLGTFVLTIIYCLMLLASIGPGDAGGSNAYLSVTVAIGLALFSVALLVLYIHDLATSIMSETLIETVGRELDQGVRDLRPLGQTDDPEQALPEDFAERAALAGSRLPAMSRRSSSGASSRPPGRPMCWSAFIFGPATSPSETAAPSASIRRTALPPN